MLQNFLVAELRQHGLAVDLCDAASKAAQRRSGSLAVQVPCDSVPQWLDALVGTHMLIASSPRRGRASRKRWFVKVALLASEEVEELRIREDDVAITYLRSSGPGGQHVNKTSSAVRLTHLPSGIVIVARNERSQHLNRKAAFERLHAQLFADFQQKQSREAYQRHALAQRLERGNAVRSYTLNRDGELEVLHA